MWFCHPGCDGGGRAGTAGEGGMVLMPRGGSTQPWGQEGCLSQPLPGSLLLLLPLTFITAQQGVGRKCVQAETWKRSQLHTRTVPESGALQQHMKPAHSIECEELHQQRSRLGHQDTSLGLELVTLVSDNSPCSALDLGTHQQPVLCILGESLFPGREHIFPLISFNF